ncbi:MAG: sulfatase-like hydrolase/transferase [Luteitalea sp.]|nr:sulfatase-like hydrolase/transferase [Luteitalea sp.]
MRRLSDHSREALHIFALSAFAIAQPLFDVLGRDATFFVAQGSAVTEVLLFSAVLLFGPPLLIVTATRLVGLLWSPAHRMLHNAAIGGLAGLTIAPPVTRLLQLGTAGWLAILLGVGVLAIGAYSRWPRFGEMLTWMAAAPVVFLAVFLFGSSVRYLLLPAQIRAEVEAVSAGVKADVPIVMLVFDELPLASLLRSDGTIHESRYPNFARLAKSSTWYRNATTNAEQTSRVIPSLLTGRVAEESKIPAASAYPETLFTLLSGGYTIHATEFITRMCPPTCIGPSDRGSFWSLLTDAGIVYLHAASPADMAEDGLPPLGDRWTGFGGSGAPTRNDFSEWRRADAGRDPIARFVSITGRISRAESPALWYVHIGFPHEPWRFLPTLQAYAGHSRPGLRANGQWGPSQPALDHSLQRHLLQLKAADRLLGRLLDRIESAGLFDESLLLVLADHGAAFRAGGSRRSLDGKNTAEILPVPLFVKYPGQQQGSVDTRNAELIDVLPTVADVLGVRVPWAMDGASLRRDDPERGYKRVFMSRQQKVRRFGRSINGIDRISRRIEQLFGPGGDQDDLYRFGPHRDLVGTSVSAITLLPASHAGVQVRLDDVAAYQNVDPSGPFVPAMLTGTVSGGVTPSTPVAVAVNGSIAGTGWTYEDSGDVRLGIMLSPRYFSRGRNSIEVYRVESAARLRPFPLASQLTYRVVSDANQKIVGFNVSDGRTLSLEKEGFVGMLDHVRWTARVVSINGWAADLARQQTPRAFLIVYRGRVVQVVDTRPRRDVAKHHSDAFTDSGIMTDVAPALVPDERLIEVYAIFDNAAFLVLRDATD